VGTTRAVSYAFDNWLSLVRDRQFARGTSRLLKFVAANLKHSKSVRRFEQVIKDNGYQKFIHRKDPSLEFLLSPYICSNWQPEKRFVVMLDHYRFVSAHLTELGNGPDLLRQVASLKGNEVTLTLALDRPKWFNYEGELVLNLFQDDLRIMSIAFSFAEIDGEWVAVIGAFQGLHQGVDPEKRQSLNKELTKAFWGVRPRNLLLFCFRKFLQPLGINKIFGISDSARIHRAEYFTGKDGKNKIFPNNYDEIWVDLGAIKMSDEFFQVPIEEPRKSIETIESSKRSLYRKRYAFFDSFKLDSQTGNVCDCFERSTCD
jgi:uncharacterized protein VirK/YbjX